MKNLFNTCRPFYDAPADKADGDTAELLKKIADEVKANGVVATTTEA